MEAWLKQTFNLVANGYLWCLPFFEYTIGEDKLLFMRLAFVDRRLAFVDHALEKSEYEQRFTFFSLLSSCVSSFPYPWRFVFPLVVSGTTPVDVMESNPGLWIHSLSIFAIYRFSEITIIMFGKEKRHLKSGLNPSLPTLLLERTRRLPKSLAYKHGYQHSSIYHFKAWNYSWLSKHHSKKCW